MITSTGGIRNNQNEFMQRTGSMEDLDKHAFLKLLITQMQYQDPLDPQDNSEFVAQMAQFTSLEQVQNIGEGMEKIIAGLENQDKFITQMENLNGQMEELLLLFQMSHYANYEQGHLTLLGQNVTVRTEEGDEITGTVTAVKFTEEGTRFVMDGQSYRMNQVIKVESGTTHE